MILKSEVAMKLLVIEDDQEISEMLSEFLESEAFAIVTAADGEEAIRIFKENHFDLILLDLMIPKINGMEVMRQIRSCSIIPIIILSAKDTDSDKSLGLGLGADDYITKPFSVTELLARIKANIRRSTQYLQTSRQESEQLGAGSITMDLDSYAVKKDNQTVELTAKEFEILKLLLQNPKKVYTKAMIYSLVWNDSYLGDENAVNVHISRLRTKIEDDPKNPRYIITVWGIGYKLGDVNG